MNKGEVTILLIGSSKNANIYYATQFRCPDNFALILFADKKYLMVRGLEVSRAKKQVAVNDVFAFEDYWGGTCETEWAVSNLLHELKSSQNIIVPGNFPFSYGDHLNQTGFRVTANPDPFFEERMIKSEQEVNYILDVQHKLEEVLHEVVKIVKESEIRGDYLYTSSFGSQWLTVGYLKSFINLELYKRGCLAENTIVAFDKESVEPHNEGSDSTVLMPGLPIVIDVFPRSRTTFYHSDMTITLVKDKATPKLKEQHKVVLEAQKLAMSLIKAGVDGSEVNQQVVGFFTKEGFGEKVKHRVGHGIGLELHEDPYIGLAKQTLPEGSVITVEPGLYSEEDGGARDEDTVVVTKEGCRNLTNFPTILEVV